MYLSVPTTEAKIGARRPSLASELEGSRTAGFSIGRLVAKLQNGCLNISTTGISTYKKSKIKYGYHSRRPNQCPTMDVSDLDFAHKAIL